MKRIFVATTLFLATVPTITMAQTAGKFAWQTVEDRLKASQSVAALSPTSRASLCQESSISKGFREGLSLSAQASVLQVQPVRPGHCQYGP